MGARLPPRGKWYIEGICYHASSNMALSFFNIALCNSVIVLGNFSRQS